jgi:hypothetical protein
VSGFYEYHGHYGRGPVINPVPSSAERRRALSHLSPLEPKPVVGRARLRQKVPARPPRAIPDERWDELFAAMGCERDRALLEFSVSVRGHVRQHLSVRVRPNPAWRKSHLPAQKMQNVIQISALSV